MLDGVSELHAERTVKPSATHLKASDGHGELPRHRVENGVRRQRTSITTSRRGTISPMTGAPGTSPTIRRRRWFVRRPAARAPAHRPTRVGVALPNQSCVGCHRSRIHRARRRRHAPVHRPSVGPADRRACASPPSRPHGASLRCAKHIRRSRCPLLATILSPNTTLPRVPQRRRVQRSCPAKNRDRSLWCQAVRRHPKHVAA